MQKYELIIEATERFRVEVEAESLEDAEEAYYNGVVEIQWDDPISGVSTELLEVNELP